VVVLILFMVVIVALAALVVAFVAYPHRGEELPTVPWLGEVMARAADAAPTLPTDGDPGLAAGDALIVRSRRSGQDGASVGARDQTRALGPDARPAS
jgi:hypothetical protein